MSLPIDRLWNAASKLLDTVGAYYEEHDVELPERRYVSPGLPAWDCEQVTVYVERTYAGEQLEVESIAAIDCLTLRHAIMVVEVARDTPMADLSGDVPVIPSVEAEEEAAQRVLADPMLIVNAAVEAYRAGALGGCRGLSIVDWEALGPEAGLAGGRQRFRWQLTEV